MRRIVVGVDGSFEAAEAVRWALDEARRRRARLTAVLAWDEVEADRAARDGRGAPIDVTSRVAELVARAVPGQNAEIECEVLDDQPARALIETSVGADLLVLGARGTGASQQPDPGIGSVSQQCAMHSSVPVVVVRPRLHTTTMGEERIVVGIDGSETSMRALSWALDEARFRGAGVTVVSARLPSVLGDDVARFDGRSVAERATALVDRALMSARTDGLSSPIDRVIVHGDATSAILAAAQDATLVVVGTRGLGGFPGLQMGSVSQHILNRAPCSVVLVPPCATTGPSPSDSG